MSPQNKPTLEEKVERTVAEILAPAFETECAAQVRFYGITEDGKAKMGLKTPCGNCPRAHHTIRQSVEVALRSLIPEVEGIEPFYL